MHLCSEKHSFILDNRPLYIYKIILQKHFLHFSEKSLIYDMFNRSCSPSWLKQFNRQQHLASHSCSRMSSNTHLKLRSKPNSHASCHTSLGIWLLLASGWKVGLNTVYSLYQHASSNDSTVTTLDECNMHVTNKEPWTLKKCLYLMLISFICS